ncbi:MULTISPECIES: hypothetical protein [unclassified Rhizobium]|uniref:hypothetical protein n=1 Tax=unclassified Rhizobium TaxID=2613769 RepID=UPI001FEEE6C8|nr:MULTISPECIES: hypothetical protein [unclassified Rhizobium]
MASSVSSRRNALETVEAEKDSRRAVSLTEPMENTISAMNNAPRYKSDLLSRRAHPGSTAAISTISRRYAVFSKKDIPKPKSDGYRFLAALPIQPQK